MMEVTVFNKSTGGQRWGVWEFQEQPHLDDAILDEHNVIYRVVGRTWRKLPGSEVFQLHIVVEITG